MVRIKISNIWYSAYRFFDTPVISRTVDIANISYDFTTSNTGRQRRPFDLDDLLEHSDGLLYLPIRLIRNSQCVLRVEPTRVVWRKRRPFDLDDLLEQLNCFLVLSGI